MGTLKHVWVLLKKDYHKFEADPAFQLRYHRRMTIFWICNLPFITILVYFNIRAILGGASTKLALLLDAVMFAVNTYYSLYALICTEAGDAHGAYASLKAEEIQKHQAQPDEFLH